MPFAFTLNGFTYFSLSFQSSFHLSLTVLVRYRSLQRIFSFRRILPPVLCCSPKQHDSHSWKPDLMTEMRPGQLTGLLPSMARCLNNELVRDDATVGTRSSRPQFPHARHGDFRIELSPASLAVTEGILVSFFSSA